MSQEKQNEDVNAADAAAAMLLGIGDGVKHKIDDINARSSRLITPGDQRHIPHPVDDVMAGISGALQTLATPADMNIRHSAHPVDHILDAHEALVRTTADNFSEKGLTQGLRELSAFATAAAIDNVDPFKKLNAIENITEVTNMADAVADTGQAGKILDTIEKVTPVPSDWNTYAHLLGHGSQPPTLKPLRDFSDRMQYQPQQFLGETSRLIYEPSKDHKMFMWLEHRTVSTSPLMQYTIMDYLVRADKALSPEAGTGSEMFHSAMKLIRQNGVTIDQINSKWSGNGNLAANYDIFVNAREQGATIKEAIALTPTGKWAADAGYTEVGGQHFNYAISAPTLPNDLHPEFKRPVFSEDEAYNTYGNAWANAQGRSRQDLVPRDSVDTDNTRKVLSKLEQELMGRPPEQADIIWQQIEAHFAKQADASGANIDPEFKK